MRKNQFRSILLAALVVTAIGGLNSCKDYDDDIAELRNEIRTQSTDLNSLVADKVHNLEIEANNLQAQLSSLETAYKTADAALQTSINNAVADAKNAASSEVVSKAEAAEKAAESYADLKAAEAQRAAVAAAQGLVTDAQNALKSSIDAANATLAEQGKSIASLLQADKELQQGINTATARANEAYTLANQALEAAKAAQAAAEKAQGTADEAKLQAAQNATTLATIAENLKNAQETLTSQINVFGSQVSAVQAQAAENKAKIEGQATQLADMKAANQKAQDAIDALGTKLNDQVEALKGLISTNLEKINILERGLDAVKSDVATLQGDVNGLKADVASLLTANTALETKINNAINDVTGQIATLNGSIETNVNNLQSIINDLKTGKIASLEEAVDELTKKLEGVATSGDVEAVNTKITEIKTDLGKLQTAVNALTSDAATKSDIEAAIGELGIAGLTSRIEALEGVATAEKIAAAAKVAADAAAKAAVDELLTKIENGEFSQDLSGINTAISTLQEEYDKIDNKIATEVTAKINELKPGIIEELTKTLSGSIEKGDQALQDEVDILVQILADYMGIDLSDEEGEVKLFAAAEEGNSKAATLLEKLQEQVKNVSSASDVTNKTLQSISLIPQLYIKGIEAIEFSSLDYVPVKPGSSGNDPIADPTDVKNHILVDNGTTTAYYRLNPQTVGLDQIDTDNIKYYAATAETRSPSVASPVEYNGIEVFSPGIMGVKLRKTVTGSLNNAPDGNIYIVALSVPRKANSNTGVEAAEVVSENSRVVESTMTPKIARLPWNTDATLLDRDGNPSNIHHYSDSAVVYKSKVDNNPLQMVYEKVEYNKTYNVLDHVTGCDKNAAAGHKEITKKTLKSYGLTFRFAIPTTAYKEDVDHSTDQQQFASIDPITGIVSSKLPNGTLDNKACVGKEPIIRIMLVDTVNNKLVDEKYMKIKWIEKDLGTVTLKDYETETELKPCSDVDNATSIIWEKFINDVYAKVGATGMSQAVFEQVYPVANVDISNPTPANSDKFPKTVLVNAQDPAKPTVELTKNKNGDAIIANWQLTPAEIGRIYPSQTKTFSVNIVFKSSVPTQYPSLKLTWKWTIKLPKFPSIAGYYSNYWFNPYEEHDITPVQYATARYDDFLTAAGKIKEGKNNGVGKHLAAYDPADNSVAPGTPYCVFYNDLMNAFQYDQTSGLIVKDLYECSKWDMQFTWTGNDKFSGSYTQYPGYAPLKLYDGDTPIDFQSPSLYQEKWDEQRTYVLNKITNDRGTNGEPALQMVWGDKDHANFEHIAWKKEVDYRNATLYADHKNPYNQVLLNKLLDENEADGWTPKRTHTKAINIGVWATLNDWNIIPLKKYDIYLIEPLRINSSLGGVFEDLIINGTAISCADAFTLTDFAGYDVAENDIANPSNRQRYRSALWKYYELTKPDWKLNDVKYGFDKNTLEELDYETASYANAISAAELKAKTNGNMDLSIEQKKKGDVEYLVFKNNGGSSVVRDVAVFIPVEVTYGFGKVTATCKVKVTPKGSGLGTPFDDL